MLDKFKWLGKEEEVAFEKNTFKGKLAAKSWKYSKNIDALIRIRILIFIMAVIVIIPALTNHIIHDQFSLSVLIERFVFSFMMVIAGLLFNKYRTASIILACIPVGIILYMYVFVFGIYDYKILGFNGAMLLFFLSGFYHDHQLKTLRKELEQHLNES